MSSTNSLLGEGTGRFTFAWTEICFTRWKT